MPLFYSSHATVVPTTYLFIDGASLSAAIRSISERYFEGSPLAVNWERLKDVHRKAFYYDAIPVRGLGEDQNGYSERIAPKQAELSSIERERGYHVRTGDVRRRKNGNEQKMVDVQLAVDALLMASRNLFTGCTIITSDLDFYPLVTALVEMGIDVTLQYQDGHVNSELLAAADHVLPITFSSWLGLLQLSAEQKALIPEVYIGVQNGEEPVGVSLVAWEDDRFGACLVHAVGNSLVLHTGRDPNNPISHRLVAKASNKFWLRTYIGDTYGLEIPDWG